jgi:hypothetical protein
MAELNRRYVVMAMATEAPFDPADPEGVFVLKPWKDPAALRALAVYRDNCYPELGHDLDAWIRAIETGPVVRGDVGRRNESHLRPKSAGGSTARAPKRPRPKASHKRAPAGKRPARQQPRSSHRKKRRK